MPDPLRIIRRETKAHKRNMDRLLWQAEKLKREHPEWWRESSKKNLKKINFRFV